MFSEFVNGGEKCLRSKAEFRANRERLGATQDDFAQALNVAVRTIKRWESPDFQNPPEDAWAHLNDLREDHELAAAEIARKLDEIFALAQRELLVLPYYRVAEDNCPPAGVSGMSNAQLREAAALCKAPIAFAYDSEIEKDIVYWMIKLALDIEEHGDDEPCFQLFESSSEQVTIFNADLEPRLVCYSLNSAKNDFYDEVEESTLGETYWAFRELLKAKNPDDMLLVGINGNYAYLCGEITPSSYRESMYRKRGEVYKQGAEKWKQNLDLVDWFTELYEALQDNAPFAIQTGFDPANESIDTIYEIREAIIAAGLNTYEYDMFLGNYTDADFDLCEADIDYEDFYNCMEDEERYEVLTQSGLDPEDYLDAFDDVNIAFYGPGYYDEDEEEDEF